MVDEYQIVFFKLVRSDSTQIKIFVNNNQIIWKRMINSEAAYVFLIIQFILSSRWEFYRLFRIFCNRNPNKFLIIKKKYVASEFIMRFQKVW